MNYKFRKKPVIIEAYQMTKERRINNMTWPNWLNDAWNKDHDEEGSVWPEEYPLSKGKDKLIIHTLEGNMLVDWGDYICYGTGGELYPCKPDRFLEVHEPVPIED